MKKQVLTIAGIIGLVLVLLALPFMTSCAPSSKEAIVLNAAGFLPLKSSTIWPLMELRDRVNAQSEQQGITINIVGGPEAIPMFEQPKALKEGVIDIVQSPDAWFGVPEGLAMPYSQFTCPEEREKGVQDFLQGHFNNANVYYLGGAVYIKGYYISTVYRVDTLEDLRGLKMPVSPAQAPAFKALGIVGVDIDDAEIYTGLDRGMLGGVTEPISLQSMMGWGEVLNYIIDHPFYQGGHVAMLMNLDSWNRLSGKQQKFLSDTYVAIEKEIKPRKEAEHQKQFNMVLDAGVEVIKFPPAVEKQFLDLVDRAAWEQIKPKLSPESYAKLRELLLK